jgi:hypothetical protein
VVPMLVVRGKGPELAKAVDDKEIANTSAV